MSTTKVVDSMRDALASDEGKEFVTDIEEKIKVERAKL